MATVLFKQGASTVELKAPALGDSETQNDNFSLLIMADGSVTSYRKEKKTILLLTFQSIKRSDTDAFIAFYKATLGETIYYFAQDGYVWEGKILNDPLDTIIRTGSGSCELVDFTVQMQATESSEFVTLVNDDGDILDNNEDDILIGG